MSNKSIEIQDLNGIVIQIHSEVNESPFFLSALFYLFAMILWGSVWQSVIYNKTGSAKSFKYAASMAVAMYISAYTIIWLGFVFLDGLASFTDLTINFFSGSVFSGIFILAVTLLRSFIVDMRCKAFPSREILYRRLIKEPVKFVGYLCLFSLPLIYLILLTRTEPEVLS